MFCIQQIGESDCGIAAVKTLMANLFNKEEYLYIKEDEEHGPYSFSELIEFAKGYGVTLLGVEYEAPEFEILPSQPFLVVFTLSEHTNHLIYVSKIKKRSVEIFDPGKGKKVISKKEFFEYFKGKALVVEDYKEINLPEPKNEDITTKDQVIASIIQIISIAFFIAGIMFIDSESYIFVPIIFLMLYLIVQLLLEKYLVSLLKKVDANYVDELKGRPKNTKLFLLRLAEYKKTLFVGPIKLTTDIIAVIFLGVVMVLNNRYMAFTLLFAIMFALIDFVFIDDYIKKKEDKLAREEAELDYFDGDEFYLSIKDVTEGAYGLALIKRSSRYITLFVLLLSVLLVMIVSKIVSVPFLLLNFIFALTIFDHFRDILTSNKNEEKKKVDYMKLNNLM